jgi:hypothetical protein
MRSGMPEAAKLREYAQACREMAARISDAEAKRTLLRMAEAWEEVVRETRAGAKQDEH